MRCHIAILKRPYLDLILADEKTIECRLSRIARAPFQSVTAGDLIVFKESAGPIRGRARVEQVEFFKGLTPGKITQIRRKYNHLIKADADFWQSRAHCRYGSLIWLRTVKKIQPFWIKRKGLQSWIILDDKTVHNHVLT